MFPALESAEYGAWVRAIERLLPAPPADALDIGTGTGFVALIASQLGHHAIGLDLSTAMLAEARMHAQQRGLKASFQTGDASGATIRRSEPGRYYLPPFPVDTPPARRRPRQLASAFAS